MLPQMIELRDPYNAWYRIPVVMRSEFERLAADVVIHSEKVFEAAEAWEEFWDVFGIYRLLDKPA